VILNKKNKNFFIEVLELRKQILINKLNSILFQNKYVTLDLFYRADSIEEVVIQVICGTTKK
tara:strand:- start:471 stop:656 length:186 start_codon:yes stop_codon:yes gene_type:complete